MRASLIDAVHEAVAAGRGGGEARGPGGRGGRGAFGGGGGGGGGDDVALGRAHQVTRLAAEVVFCDDVTSALGSHSPQWELTQLQERLRAALRGLVALAAGGRAASRMNTHAQASVETRIVLARKPHPSLIHPSSIPHRAGNDVAYPDPPPRPPRLHPRTPRCSIF